MNIDELRCAVTEIWRSQSQIAHHDWRGHLYLDFDLSGLPCGKQAEKEPERLLQRQKNVTGRQLARVSSIQYRETLWSELYPGNRHTVTCFRPAVLAAESSLELANPHLDRIVWRMDGGAGSDAELIWLLKRGYHVMAKGISSRRAHALAKQVRRWDAYPDCWLGEVPPPIDYGKKIRCFVKRRIKNGQNCHSYYLSTLSLPSKGHFYVCL